jgi:hypothetical protein
VRIGTPTPFRSLFQCLSTPAYHVFKSFSENGFGTEMQGQAGKVCLMTTSSPDVFWAVLNRTENNAPSKINSGAGKNRRSFDSLRSLRMTTGF